MIMLSLVLIENAKGSVAVRVEDESDNPSESELANLKLESKNDFSGFHSLLKLALQRQIALHGLQDK
jgi:hypothetical protein